MRLIDADKLLDELDTLHCYYIELSEFCCEAKSKAEAVEEAIERVKRAPTVTFHKVSSKDVPFRNGIAYGY